MSEYITCLWSLTYGWRPYGSQQTHVATLQPKEPPVVKVSMKESCPAKNPLRDDIESISQCELCVKDFTTS